MISPGTLTRSVVSALTITACLTILGRQPLEAAGPSNTLYQCTVYCRIDQCGDATHRALTPYSIDEVDHGYHSMCMDAYCGWESSQSPREHDVCAGGFLDPDDYAALESAIAQNDFKTIADLTTNNSSTMEVDVDRSSIQIVGCNGRVTGNLPLTAVQLEMVLERLKH